MREWPGLSFLLQIYSISLSLLLTHTRQLFIMIIEYMDIFTDHLPHLNCYLFPFWNNRHDRKTKSARVFESLLSFFFFPSPVKYNEYNLDLNNLRLSVCERQAVQRKNSGALKTRASNARENSKVI